MPESNPNRAPRRVPARVECIIARNAATAVIFRRGPTRFVRMLRWNLRNDKIEPGQWIEGRVHVARSDVSPDGELVACFVASYRRRLGTWTAISRPPYFTALAVWPKGDTWGGGGLFVSNSHFLLAHSTTRINSDIDEFKLMDGFTLPKRFRMQPFVRHSPVHDCDVQQARMVPSGWRFVQRYVWRVNQSLFAEPEIMARPLDNPKQPRFELRRSRLSFEILRAEVHDLQTGTHRDLGEITWVDADHKGDVLWSKDGKLFRLAGPARRGMKMDAEPKLVADLNDMTFEAIEAPKSAMKWP
jgi:hypothetical protein